MRIEMRAESFRRFYSHWIHVLWVYRWMQNYFIVRNRNMDTVAFFLYGIMGGCDYANSMYPIWHNRLHAVGEDVSVADKFSIYEFFVAFLASLASSYWLLDTQVPDIAWLVILACSWIGHLTLANLWQSRIGKLKHAAYRHVPI